MRNTRFASGSNREGAQDADQQSAYAFGGSYNSKFDRPNSARQQKSNNQLTKGALAKFDQRTSHVKGGRPPMAARKPLDPEVIVHPGDTLRQEQLEAVPEGFTRQEESKGVHKDYGKTPAYLEKYK